jgi:hypothetical protein
MPKTKFIDTIKDDHIVALAQFISAEGSRKWKTELSDAWTTGRYPAHCRLYTPLLQQIRNGYEHSKLFKLSVAEIRIAADVVTVARAQVVAS